MSLHDQDDPALRAAQEKVGVAALLIAAGDREYVCSRACAPCPAPADRRQCSAGRGDAWKSLFSSGF